MNSGFRAWFYRFISTQFGLLGLIIGLTLVELSRLYGINSASTLGWIILVSSFLVLISAFFITWTWKRYVISSLVVGAVMTLIYMALRPEMIRNDLLNQYKNPPLSADLIIYRSIILRDDLDKDLKIERLNFFYGFLKSFSEKAASEQRAPIPESK